MRAIRGGHSYTAIDGIARAQGQAGVDIGAQETVHESVVLEAAPGHLGQQLFAHDYGSEPVSESIIRFDRKPGEFGADALIADLAERAGLP